MIVGCCFLEAFSSYKLFSLFQWYWYGHFFLFLYSLHTLAQIARGNMPTEYEGNIEPVYGHPTTGWYTAIIINTIQTRTQLMCV